MTPDHRADIHAYELHIASINAQYASVYQSLFHSDQQAEGLLYAKLSEAVQFLSDKQGLWISLPDFLSRYPQVQYSPNQPMAIFDGERHWELVPWLSKQGHFIDFGSQRCYSWLIDVTLTPQEPYFDFYLYLLLRRVTSYQVNDVLDYHLLHSFHKDVTACKAAIQDALLWHRELLAFPPGIVHRVESWLQQEKHELKLAARRGRKLKQEGGDRQKSLAILMRLLLDEGNFKCTQSQMTQAFESITGYSGAGLNNVMSALVSKSDRSFQFHPEDFDKTQDLLEAMLSNLEMLRKNKC